MAIASYKLPLYLYNVKELQPQRERADRSLHRAVGVSVTLSVILC
ncbi:hypothetical protein [Baaleninema simplex]|nr:hypothetical protein [Baaleninema simplex]